MLLVQRMKESLISRNRTHLASILRSREETEAIIFAYKLVKMKEQHVGRDSSVGIAIRYWLDGPGIEPLACWDCGFEFRRGHGCLCCVCCTIRTKGKARTKQYRQSTEREQKKNPGMREIFRTRPYRPWRLLQNGYRVFFPGVKPKHVDDLRGK